MLLALAMFAAMVTAFAFAKRAAKAFSGRLWLIQYQSNAMLSTAIFVGASVASCLMAIVCCGFVFGWDYYLWQLMAVGLPVYAMIYGSLFLKVA